MRLPLLAGLIIGLTMSTQSPGPPADPLATYRWTHRLLVVHVPDTPAGRDALARLRSELEARHDEVVDRDLLIVQVGELSPAAPPLRPSVDLAAPQRAAVRQTLDLPDSGTQLVLIGKDGGVKDRQTDGFDLPRVFTLIDGMPMRRSEVRRR